MNKTSIAWTDYTSNPIRARNLETDKVGHYCPHVSEGCEHCYAGTWNRDRFGTGLDFIAQNRDKVELFLNEAELREWAKPKYAGARVFVADMTDWCHDLVTDDMRDRLFAAMAQAPAVTFQLLTKRPEAMRDYLTSKGRYGLGRHNEIELAAPGHILPRLPLPNVWLGVTAENQRWAAARIPVLLDTPAAVRFVSYEPALGPLNLQAIPYQGDTAYFIDTLGGRYKTSEKGPGTPFSFGMAGKGTLDWVIAGGESGATPRPFEAQWARDVRDQCARTSKAFFMKQMGGKRFPDDRLESLPEDLRVREFPT